MDRLTTYHEWEANGKRYRAVYDEDYEVEGSSASDDDDQDARDWAEERRKLNSGAWVVLGVVVYELLPEKPHCASCTCEHPPVWQETDSLWGIVVTNTCEAIEEYVRECM